jgi:hypothetical protein
MEEMSLRGEADCAEAIVGKRQSANRRVIIEGLRIFISL